MNRRTAAKALGIAVSVACLVYFASRASLVWQEAHAGALIRDSLGATALSLGPYMAAYFLFATMWDFLLRALGCHTSLLRSWGIFLTAQFAKYLPGNVGHHAGRVALSIRVGYPGSRVAASMMLEIVIVALTAAVLSLPAIDLLASRLPRSWAHASVSVLAAIAVAAALLLAAALLWRHRFVDHARSAAKGIADIVRSRRCRGWIAASAFVSISAFILSGLPLILMGGSASSLSLPQAATFIALFGVSWVAGFLAPGAPAGLGVREAILAQGLTPMLGQERAVTVTLLFRALTVAADLMAFAAGLLLLKIAERRPAATPPA